MYLLYNELSTNCQQLVGNSESEICPQAVGNSIILFLAVPSQPIGVAEFQLTKFIPDEFKSSLPSIEDIELELR